MVGRYQSQETKYVALLHVERQVSEPYPTAPLQSSREYLCVPMSNREYL